MGIHCISGLGRAPVLVAIALIELGMEPLDAIEFIRSKRRGAFNRPQICYLVNMKMNKSDSNNKNKVNAILLNLFFLFFFRL